MPRPPAVVNVVGMAASEYAMRVRDLSDFSPASHASCRPNSATACTTSVFSGFVREASSTRCSGLRSWSTPNVVLIRTMVGHGFLTNSVGSTNSILLVEGQYCATSPPA